MIDPVISIVIPAYNSEKYISDLIQHIKLQSFKNFEVIIIDDGSTDDTLVVINETVNGDKRFFIKSISNVGQGVARYVGVQYARAKYITFVDADDLVDTEWLNIVVGDMESTAADIININYTQFSRNVPVVSVEVEGEDGGRLINQEESYVAWMKDKSLKGFLWNKIFKTEIIKKNLLPLKFNFLEDSYTVLKCLKNVKNVYMEPKVLYFYRIHKGSSIKSKLHDGDILSLKYITEELDAVCNNFFPQLKIFSQKRIAKVELLLLSRMSLREMNLNSKLLLDFVVRFNSNRKYNKFCFNYIEIFLFKNISKKSLLCLIIKIRNGLIFIQEKTRVFNKIIRNGKRY